MEGAKYYTYNPYEGLNTLLDTAVSQEGYKIPSMPEFIFEEERSIKKRSWSENLTFYTGCAALGGMASSADTLQHLLKTSRIVILLLSA